MTLYAYKDPRGHILWSTVETTKDFAYHEAWATMPEVFQAKYWKKVGPAKLAMRNLGYRCVEVKIVEVKRKKPAPEARTKGL